jgi:hypothetical protein
MPLKKGRSKKVISENIGEIMSSFGRTGKIGTSKPKSKRAASKQAAAIAYSEAGRPQKKSKGGVMGPVRTVKKRDGNEKVKIY